MSQVTEELREKWSAVIEAGQSYIQRKGEEPLDEFETDIILELLENFIAIPAGVGLEVDVPTLVPVVTATASSALAKVRKRYKTEEIF